MLNKKYYLIISKILNDNFKQQKFNYGVIYNYSHNQYSNYVKKCNLKLFFSYLKKWRFVEYKRGGKYPFSLKMEIPLTLVDEICQNKIYTNEQRIEILKQHYVVLMRKNKIIKIKENY
jgi:hypothetical protein